MNYAKECSLCDKFVSFHHTNNCQKPVVLFFDIHLNRPCYFVLVTKQRDPETAQQSLLFQVIITFQKINSNKNALV